MAEPVAIGGLGGSGTRLVAHVVRELGFHLGDDLNHALDNLAFTLLFRRPTPLDLPAGDLRAGIELFADAMRGRWSPSDRQCRFLRQAQDDTVRIMTPLRSDRDWETWVRKRAELLQQPSAAVGESVGWGWKESCTNFYLEPLAEMFPRMRYVHIVRHGLELAHSALTQFQAYLWGHRYGVELPEGHRPPSPTACLRFWARANREAIAMGESLLGDRFLLLRYESICENPIAAVDEIAAFLGVHPGEERTAELSSFVRSAPPSRRRPERESEEFEWADLAAVADLGFSL